MKRFPWLAAALIVVAGLSAGCSNKPATSAPPASAAGGPPKEGDSKAKAVRGGIENPPPP